MIAALQKSFAPLVLSVLLCSCQMMSSRDISTERPAPGTFAKGTPEWRGQKFARNRCSDCHAVDPVQVSPNANAPSFNAIASREDLTRDSLTQWLNSVHAYPRAMYFEIPKEHIDDLVAYMLTLRAESDATGGQPRD